jgi:serine phosphatase RsbU (regulator of sigma subunit)
MSSSGVRRRRCRRSVSDEALVEVGPEAGGADFVGVGFLDEAQTKFDLFHRRSGGGPQHLEFAVSADGALMAVLRRGQPLEFQDRSQLDRFPVLVELLGTEMKRLVCIPLIDSSKLLRGVIAFMFAAGSHVLVDPGTERRSTIAELTAQTVERAMLYLHEHELVVDLQRQTLADLPDVAGLQIAARYLPSSATIGLGGDWYDVYVLGDGRVGMVIGDVSGHGIDAIADMTEFRTTVSTLLRTNQELGTIAQMSTALLKAQDTTDVRFATAGLMVLDLGAKTLAYVRAGHPPMLVREPGGNVVVLERGGGGPIGVTDVDIAVQTVAVESGSVIVAYTDGLIERRDEPIDIGLDRLLRALGECSSIDLWGGAEAIADVLVEQCLGGRQTADDAAVLVVVVE